MAARSLGKKDSLSDAATAGLTMFKVKQMPDTDTGLEDQEE